MSGRRDNRPVHYLPPASRADLLWCGKVQEFGHSRFSHDWEQTTCKDCLAKGRPCK